MWTPEQKHAARELWTAERRLELALKRKANPIGNRSKQWWREHPEARMAAGARLNRQPTMDDLWAAFELADRVRKKLQEGGW